MPTRSSRRTAFGRGAATFGLLLALAAPTDAADQQAVGQTGSGQRIDAFVVPAAPANSERGAAPSGPPDEPGRLTPRRNGDAPTVLVIGGLAGRDGSAAAVNQALTTYDRLPLAERRFRLIAIPLANPDGAPLAFPPAGVAYRENIEAHVLWRWIGVHAPDLVLIAGADAGGLADALGTEVVAGVGRIPARRADASSGLLDAVPATIAASEARREIERRRARSPRDVANELGGIYGHDFNQFTYIPGMALIGRLRLGHDADVARLAAPWVDGSRDPLARPNSLALAGHLVFAELADRTGDAMYVRALLRAAGTGFTDGGALKESMPYHGEMSDSLFMETALLARAGRLTGETRYFDMAARHVAFMQALVWRADGLYRHSPLTPAAWGRGNGFPALGLALTLEALPPDHSGFAPMLQTFQRHMAALAPHQDLDGLWHQVIDEPGSYAEFSATAMIGAAMQIGVRHGWLDRATYRPRVDAAWQAVVSRIGRDGLLHDVSESTNKQPTDEDYRRRAAILDQDPRGGGMALFFATELLRTP